MTCDLVSHETGAMEKALWMDMNNMIIAFAI